MQIQHQPVIEYNAQLTSLRDLIFSPKGHCQSMIAYKQVIPATFCLKLTFYKCKYFVNFWH